MQTENSDEGGNGGIMAQASGEPAVLQAQAGSEQVLRVTIDGRVFHGKAVEVNAVSADKLVSWDKLQPGFVYVDRDETGKVSGVMQTASATDERERVRWRWVDAVLQHERPQRRLVPHRVGHQRQQGR